MHDKANAAATRTHLKVEGKATKDGYALYVSGADFGPEQKHEFRNRKEAQMWLLGALCGNWDIYR